jgi:hypothetical protein
MTESQKHKIVIDGTAQLNVLIESLNKRFRDQLQYNIDYNLLAGLVKKEDLVNHAIENALVGTASKFNQWDCEKAIRFAHHILEDSNCHGEAKELNKFIPEYQ